MATKQEVADYINDVDKGEIWNNNELAYVQSKLDPYLAHCLIKLVGDVSWLIEIRDHHSNNKNAPSNRDMFT